MISYYKNINIYDKNNKNKILIIKKTMSEFNSERGPLEIF
jgi:hypothetical protein